MIQKSTKTLSIKILRYFLWTLFSIVFILGGIIGVYLYEAKSSPYGIVSHSDLHDNITISFDKSDIPHIDAKSSNDAFFALGYLHARERTWQMEFNRRLASGSLSEVFGESTLGIDRFIRTLGIRNAARAQYELLPSSTKLSLQSYANGVNAGYADLGWPLPLEFLITGTKPGFWIPVDSVSWSMMMALDLGDNWSKEFTRLQLAATLPTSKIWEVLPPYPGDEPATSVDFSTLYHQAGIYRQKVDTVPSQKTSLLSPLAEKTLLSWLPSSLEGVGSNNWVIDGKHTTSGKPLLANDPHLGLTSPAIWYVAHLRSPEMEVIGGSIPGLPGIVLGHSDQIAWGFTNTAPDVQDLFIEAIDPKNPAKYKTPTGSQSFKVRREVIMIKDQPSITMIVKETRHGPVISDVFPPAEKLIDTARFSLALKWTALDEHNQSIKALIDMNKADNLEELQSNLEHYSAPMQNVVMADVGGRISYRAAGIAPKRMKHNASSPSLMGVAPAFGWESSNDWKEYLKIDELPRIDNPPNGWIATANQKVEEDSKPYTLTSDWTMPFRYDRIAELINQKPKHDIESMMNMQKDTVSLAAKDLIPIIKNVQSNHPLALSAKNILANFSGDMRADSSAALIFNAWVDQYTRAIFASHLGDVFESEYSKRGLRGGLLQVINKHLDDWCDQVGTEKKETCEELNTKAFDQSLTLLSAKYGKNPSTWRWGDAHPAISEHRPLSKVALLKKWFEVRSPASGDGYTINVGKMNFTNPSEPFEANVAPGFRAIYDLSDLDRSMFIYQTGQSGWIQSKRFKEYSQLWSQNSYLPLALHPKEDPIGKLVIQSK